MLGQILDRLGVDDSQWRALVRVAIRLDLREAALGGSALGVKGSGTQAMVSALLLYLATGAILAPLIWLGADVLFSGTIFLTYAMFLVGGLVLLDFQAVITSPRDWAILGFQPLSSATYVAAKLSNLLVYVAIVATAVGILPIGAFLFKGGFNPALGFAAVAATYLSTGATALTMLLSYAWIVMAVPPDRLRRALSYFQLALSTVVFGGYVVLPAFLDEEQVVRLALPRVWWIWLHPATWFASYLELAGGRLERSALLAAGASLVAMGLLAAGVRRAFTLDYAHKLAGVPTAEDGVADTRARTGRRSRWFATNEAHAAALLIRAQFRYDQRFRLSVLAVIPMLLMFLFLSIVGVAGPGLAGGGFPDPFTDPEAGSRPNVLYFALVLIPVLIMMEVARSDAYRAAWIFHVTPHQAARLVVSVKNVVMLYFVIPVLLVLAAVFTYAFGHLGHALTHTLVLGLICHLYLQLAVLVAPSLPFSRPPHKIDRMNILLLNTIAVLPAMFLLQPAMAWAYRTPARLITTLAAIATVSRMAERLCARRIHRRWMDAELEP